MTFLSFPSLDVFLFSNVMAITRRVTRRLRVGFVLTRFGQQIVGIDDQRRFSSPLLDKLEQLVQLLVTHFRWVKIGPTCNDQYALVGKLVQIRYSM